MTAKIEKEDIGDGSVWHLFQKTLSFVWEFGTKFSTFGNVKFKTMSSIEKLLERFKKKPKDFTYEETLRILSYFGYEVHNKGATSGSRVRFKNEATGEYIDIHRPHPGSVMKEWMLNAVYQHLKSKNLL